MVSRISADIRRGCCQERIKWEVEMTHVSSAYGGYGTSAIIAELFRELSSGWLEMRSTKATALAMAHGSGC